MFLSCRCDWLLRFVMVLAAYYVAGRIGLTVPYVGSHVSLIWPPTGIALAALLRWNLSLWPAVWLGAFGVNLSVGSIELAAGIACGNTLGPWLAARLLRKLDFDCELPRRRDLVLYLAIGVFGGMAINATNGVAQLWLTDLLPTSSVASTWATWWLGDAMGGLITGIPLLTASRQSWRAVWIGGRGGELGAILLLILATGAWLFLGEGAAKSANPLLYLPFFLLCWLAIRGGANVASTAALLLSAPAVWVTAKGSGPFYVADVHQSLAMLWGYMATATIITVLVTVLVGELRTSERRLSLATLGGSLGLWEWNVPADRMTYTGDFQTAIGIRVEQLGSTREDWLRAIHPDDRAGVEAKLAAHLTAQTDLFDAEFRMPGILGPVWVHARGQVVEREHGGAPVRIAGKMLDVSARKQAEDEIRRLSQWNELLLNSAGEGIYGVDADGCCTFINPAALAMLGFERDEVLGRNPHALFHHPRREGVPCPVEHSALSISLRDGIRRRAEDTFIRKSGEAFLISMTATPLREDGRIVGAEVVFQDISERKAMEQELVRLASTDALTGVANRRHFLEQLEMELVRAKRFEKPASLLMIDIDFFKKVNDTHGHATGDAVLKHVTGLIGRRLRQIDAFGRLGGEEFAILLTGTNGASAWQVANQLLHAVAMDPAETDKGRIPISISIGVAEFDPADSTPESLLVCADAALYQAKAGGRNRVEVFTR